MEKDVVDMETLKEWQCRHNHARYTNREDGSDGHASSDSKLWRTFIIDFIEDRDWKILSSLRDVEHHKS